MPKPPPSPPSTDIKNVDHDKASVHDSQAGAAKGEEYARRQSAGRPSNTKR